MKVNVAGLRFIADAIEMNGKMYNQGVYGICDRPELAGTGLQCGTPCCVAGFAVLLLGDKEELLNECAPLRDKYSKTNHINHWKLGLSIYASKLLGLSKLWKRAVFDYPSWPEAWVDENYTDKLKLLPDRPCIGYRMVKPNAEQAASFLRRLADQFEQEQGPNVNTEPIRKTFTHEAELVELEQV